MILVKLIVLVCLTFSAHGSEEFYMNKCSQCHGSSDPIFPVLHGQQKIYLKKALKHYAKNKRSHARMVSIAKGLSNQEIASVTSYLGSKDFCDIDVVLDPKDGIVEEGELKTSSCKSCHGHGFKGSFGPRLAGQKTDYLIQAIKDYQSRARKGYPPMTSAVKRLSEEDIGHIAAYLNSLKDCP